MSLPCLATDYDDYSVYTCELPLRTLAPGKTYSLGVRLVPVAGAPSRDPYRPDFTRTVTVRQPEDFPLVKVRNENSRLVYNLGAPRLGGPVRSELRAGGDNEDQR
ncbi:MAG: hypothetical protein U5L72_08555 [Bacteroidales bacterium]|nr:hypothetical protein [Bacteroidales bacterium]